MAYNLREGVLPPCWYRPLFLKNFVRERVLGETITPRYLFYVDIKDGWELHVPIDFHTFTDEGLKGAQGAFRRGSCDPIGGIDPHDDSLVALAQGVDTVIEVGAFVAGGREGLEEFPPAARGGGRAQHGLIELENFARFAGKSLGRLDIDLLVDRTIQMTAGSILHIKVKYRPVVPSSDGEQDTDIVE